MSWFVNLAKTSQVETLNLEIIPECVGAAHGQTDCILKGYLNKRLVGYISYAIFEGNIHLLCLFL